VEGVRMAGESPPATEVTVSVPSVVEIMKHCWSRSVGDSHPSDSRVPPHL